MTEEEIKKLAPECKIPVYPAEGFDLNKAERCPIDKDELKVQEIQAEQEKLSNFI